MTTQQTVTMIITGLMLGLLLGVGTAMMLAGFGVASGSSVLYGAIIFWSAIAMVMAREQILKSAHD